MGRWEPGSRERLRSAAIELFSEKGFEQTTVEEIADRAGVTKRTFFRHFADKREVPFADTTQLEQSIADAVTRAPARLPPLEAIAVALTTLDWEAIGTREAQRHRQLVIADSPELTERELVKYNGFAAAFADGLGRRGVEADTGILAAQAGLAVFRTAYRRWLDEPDHEDIAALVRAALAELRALVTAVSAS
ncbi:TetR/AcrR family transcriptional regulator [Actinacidiphila glaucinigra]|uniref:TetR/AcrR family transcriptional regulator n=1 Tax=Actinacidiphila glaucinigra TaxID=235986 RepID=UPI003867B5FE